jgi:lipopolysaccharide biosynthesis regulator YciM
MRLQPYAIGQLRNLRISSFSRIRKKTNDQCHCTEEQDSFSYIEGLKALLRGHDEEAFTKLKETINNDTNNVDAYIQLGNIFRRNKKAQQALQVHRDLTFRNDLSKTEKYEILAALYLDFKELKDDTSAARAIEELLGLLPNDRFALNALLRMHEKAGEWKEAASVRKKLDKLDGGDSKRALALYKIFEGDELNRQGDPHRARLFYKEAINTDKMCLAAYIAIGDSYYDEKRLEDALGYWTKVIALVPDEGHFVFERIKKGLFEVGRYGDYADTLSTLLQSCPDHLTARLELAYFTEKKGEKDSAREHYTVALDNHPDSLLAKLGLFRLNRESGRKETADSVFKQIIRMAAKQEASSYICNNCGLHTENKNWLCPRCKSVDSFTAIKS